MYIFMYSNAHIVILLDYLAGLPPEQAASKMVFGTLCTKS